MSVGTNQARVEQVQQGMLVFKLFMGALTGISLLVGGIGIMNVLLASVVERTREIGIRKAAGAQQRHILLQFLSESVTITGVGSMIGLGLRNRSGISCDGDHATDHERADFCRLLGEYARGRRAGVGHGWNCVRTVSGTSRGAAVADRSDSPRVKRKTGRRSARDQTRALETSDRQATRATSIAGEYADPEHEHRVRHRHRIKGPLLLPRDRQRFEQNHWAEEQQHDGAAQRLKFALANRCRPKRDERAGRPRRTRRLTRRQRACR